MTLSNYDHFIVFDDSGNFLIFASMVGIKGMIMCCVCVCPGCMLTVGIATVSHHSDQPLYQQVCQDDRKGTQGCNMLLSYLN